MREDAGNVVLDASFKGVPYGVRLPLADVGSQRWNVVAGDLALPVLTLDRDALQNNLAVMAQYCDRHGVQLAPHGKTTMSPQIFRRQFELGAWAMTAATVGQAQIMREFGINRILLANQLVDPAAIRWLAAQYRRHPQLEFIFLVDDPRNLKIVDDLLSAEALDRPVPVLIELGYAGPGGRTGVRSQAAAIALARQVRAARSLVLAGVESYEGVVTNDASAEDLQAVDRFLAATAELLLALQGHGLIEREPFILSAGGSIYFDRVIAAFSPVAARLPGLEIVLRSGCYVSHDAGRYHRLSPLDGRRTDQSEPRLRNALTLWGSVLSTPEPGQAIVGIGKRDAPYDIEPPMPSRLYRTAAAGVRAESAARADVVSLADARVVRLMDQHAFVEHDPALNMQPGDLMTFDLSHPCAAFDRWRFIPLIDGQANVVDGITTYF
jgi:D-serine dehydratase